MMLDRNLTACDGIPAVSWELNLTRRLEKLSVAARLSLAGSIHTRCRHFETVAHTCKTTNFHTVAPAKQEQL